MEEILDSIRRIISRWVLTTTQLTEDAHAGDDTITVRTTRRFAAGDELLIRNAAEEMENRLIVNEIISLTELSITTPLQFDWLVSEDAAIVKTVNDQFVKAVFIGEPDIIMQNTLPAITVNATNRTSDWYTIRTTKERYNIEIGIFVQDGTHEDGFRFLLKLSDIIQKGLKNNVYPLVNDFSQTSLTADCVTGDSYIKVPSTSEFWCGKMIMLENSYYSQENTVQEVVDATTLRLAVQADFDFPVSDTIVIMPNRFVYNSWPADINFVKIHKGTLLKAAVISYFAEEIEYQVGTGWYDTQLK